ncbi:vacuolar protein sorting-associated protein 26B isoform X1 [Homo sapiens]|uniref:vacuolar protein sorting-associated protein 26B isoform X1 n=1 Tax=Homo sapiens TaxID=9606 RepID=UPI0005D023BF|nr:vacuolar protein sorting-associated protein 26B isoform X1 [Homo sapiens]XP_054223542.1 vacuolar protein sorting-associated protein 26B isoform X1 [Homo sapiens]|eukprot:XP_011540867.1 vacuolar protein sorting-associated protein 26B isoform X1 [Homo sapiens]
MSFFGFGQSVEVEILLNDAESRKRAEHKTEDGKKEKYFLFYDGETVSGKVSLALKNPNKRLEHQGIKIEFIGQIELYYDRGNHHEFVSLVKDLARPGEITQSQAFDFEFTHVEKPYESYTGQNVKLRYFLRATISRRLNDVVKEMDIVVHTLSTYPELNSSIKMEVGIEDCLHIEFEYNKSNFSCFPLLLRTISEYHSIIMCSLHLCLQKSKRRNQILAMICCFLPELK